jgi:adenylosuccinate lyase
MAMRVWKREGSLKELALKSSEVMDKVNAKELDELFSIDRYFKNIDAVYKKAGI